jgi:hypothetical protein
MKRFLQWVPAVALLCASVPTAYAQYASGTTSDGVDIGVAELDLVAGGKVVDRGILVVLAENAPVHYQAPKIPRFAIIGKEKQFYLGLGGYVRGTVSVDFGNPIDNPSYFTTADIAPVSAGNGAKTQVSMGTSNLFFNFVSLPGHKDQVGAYIDFNFDKEGYDLDLRHAYLTWRNFRAGYSYTLFSDQRCIPQTIDFEGAPSLASVRTSMFAWTWTGKKWRAGAAIESPIYSVTESSTAQLVNQRIPSIPLYVAYQWTDRHYTRLSAIARSIQYRNLSSAKNKERFGYGVQLSGVWGLTERLQLYYQGVYGDGIADYVQDLNDMNLDLVPDLKNGGKLKGTQQFGFMGGVRLSWTKRIQSNHLFSQVRSYVDHYDNATAVGSSSEARLPWDDQYKYGQYLCNNVFYSLGQLQVGVEYLWGARKNMGGAFAHDNRLQVMAQINF